MKKQRNRLVYLLLITIINLNLACQDRLIVLWDEDPQKPLEVSQTFLVDEPTVATNSHATIQVDELQLGKVDIIMIIDCSGSMIEELGYVQQYINTLSDKIGNSGLDYRFIMIANKGTGNKSLTVPPPLGASRRYKHIDTDVQSNDLYSEILEAFNSETDLLFNGMNNMSATAPSHYQTFLREDSYLNIIVVTDDNARSPYLLWNNFKSAMETYVRANFTLHGIIGTVEGDPNIAFVGSEYIDGIEATGGLQFNISTSSSWNTLFDQISDNIIDQMPETIYTLPATPHIADMSQPEDSLTIQLDGYPIPQNGNWIYDTSTNSIEFINLSLLNNGGIIDIGYSILNQLTAPTVYYLENDPVIYDENYPENSITVMIYEQELPALNNWVYNSNNNSIEFTNANLLQDGVKIEFYYDIWP